MVKITVDEEACCGSGICVLKADQVFDQRDDDGIVITLTAEPPADQYDAVRAAAAACPTSAIRLVE